MNAVVGCVTVTQSPQAFESPEHEPWATVEADSEFAEFNAVLVFSMRTQAAKEAPAGS